MKTRLLLILGAFTSLASFAQIACFSEVAEKAALEAITMSVETATDKDAQTKILKRFDREAKSEAWWSVMFLDGSVRVSQATKNLHQRTVAGVFRDSQKNLQSFAGRVEEITPVNSTDGPTYYSARVVNAEQTWLIPLYGNDTLKLSVLKLPTPGVTKLEVGQTVQNRLLTWTTPEELYALRQWVVAEFNREIGRNSAWTPVNATADYGIDINLRVIQGRRVAWVRNTMTHVEKFEGVLEKISPEPNATSDLEQVGQVRISPTETVEVPLYHWNRGKYVHEFRVLRTR